MGELDTWRTCPKTSSAGVICTVQNILQRRDVRLGHLQCLVLGQLSVGAGRGHHFSQSVEGDIETFHASAFSSVRRQSSLPLHILGDGLVVPPFSLRTSRFLGAASVFLNFCNFRFLLLALSVCGCCSWRKGDVREGEVGVPLVPGGEGRVRGAVAVGVWDVERRPWPHVIFKCLGQGYRRARGVGRLGKEVQQLVFGSLKLSAEAVVGILKFSAEAVAIRGKCWYELVDVRFYVESVGRERRKNSPRLLEHGWRWFLKRRVPPGDMLVLFTRSLNIPCEPAGRNNHRSLISVYKNFFLSSVFFPFFTQQLVLKPRLRSVRTSNPTNHGKRDRMMHIEVTFDPPFKTLQNSFGSRKLKTMSIAIILKGHNNDTCTETPLRPTKPRPHLQSTNTRR